MLHLMSMLATTLLVGLIALWTYFSVSLGPSLWSVNRPAFFRCLLGAGVPTVWLLIDLAYSGRMESNVATAQAAATVVAAIVAVVGSIIGAMWGAKEGAKATRDATMLAINADAQAAQRRREEEDRAALLALAAECRSNAKTLRNKSGAFPDPRFLVPLRQGAFAGAASALAGLDPETQHAAQRVASDTAWFNQLVAGRLIALNVSLLDGTKAQYERSFMAELSPLAASLPEVLDELASRLEGRAGREEGATGAAPL